MLNNVRSNHKHDFINIYIPCPHKYRHTCVYRLYINTQHAGLHAYIYTVHTCIVYIHMYIHTYQEFLLLAAKKLVMALCTIFLETRSSDVLPVKGVDDGTKKG